MAIIFQPLRSTLWPSGLTMLLISLVSGLLFVFTDRNTPISQGRIVLAVFVFMLCGAFQLYLTAWLNLGYLYLLLGVITSAILTTYSRSVMFFCISVIIMFSAVYFQSIGIEMPMLFATQGTWNGSWFVVGLIGFTLFFVATTYLNYVNRVFSARRQHRRQLALTEQNLDDNIEYQTFSLNIANQVNQTISRQIESDRLIFDVVNQIKTSFDYDHVQIYLLDESKKELVIAGATGEAGTSLMISEHRLPLGTGLVGQAAAFDETIVIRDVSQADQWIANPLLPNTQAEISIPINYGERLLGVLDIQHEKPTFTDEDIQLLQVVTSQLGIALNNVYLFNDINKRIGVDSQINNLALQLQISPDINTSLKEAIKTINKLFQPREVRVSVSPSMLNGEPEKETAGD
ncbi:MAG: GAF domain-containing protein [Chloroflexota bacterium]